MGAWKSGEARGGAAKRVLGGASGLSPGCASVGAKSENGSANGARGRWLAAARAIVQSRAPAAVEPKSERPDLDLGSGAGLGAAFSSAATAAA